MATIFALAVTALLVYILWRLFHRGRTKVSPTHQEPHRDFKLRWAAALLLLFFVLFGVTSDGEQDTVRGDDEPQTLAEPVVDAAPQTSPAELAEQRAAAEAAKEEAQREVRRAVAARKAANRAKARQAQAVRERKAANRAKARAENEARRAREAEAAAEAASPVYDDDDATGDGNSYLDQYAGMNCGDIPATDFPTPPGDPEGWDRDNDGVSCES